MRNNKAAASFQNELRLFALKTIHFLVGLALFAYVWLLFRYNGLPKSVENGFRYNVFVVIGYGVGVFFFNRIYNAYLLGYTRVRSLILAQAISQLFSVLIVYLVVSAAWNRFRSPLIFVPFLGIQVLCDGLWSAAATRVFFKLNPPKRAVLIYRNSQDLRITGSLEEKPMNRLYRIEKKLEFDGDFPDLVGQLDSFEAVFVVGVNSRCRNGILKYCQERNILGFFLPHVGDVIMLQAKHIQSFDSPVLFVGRKVLNPEYAIIKRAFDIAASFTGLVLLSPLLLLTALAIRLGDGGPALYRQIRLTKDGREFRIVKFRSMRMDAEKNGGARLSTSNDDRITPVGRMIRKCRLDELPQLWNILRGDMSFVGPRPERPEIAARYSKNISDFQLRLQVRAGLTGYAQIYGKYSTGPYEKLEFDLLYIKNMSVLTDIRLLFATIWVLFSPKSAEGVGAGYTTALCTGEDDCEEKKNPDSGK
ncbi:MAG: exopolysaccharide biosynthesis polyprenyl glycosylphosphotransferase [Oscillospiraceae bacterium]|nr:exopolysaccharide biosynthesis polyprenyl glycosylphosphotransferase [Oscillospiraceae bacterium]